MGDLQILNAKQIHLSEEDVKSIVEIECHPKVQEWLYEYVNPGIKKEFKDYKEFFKGLPKNRKADILIARYEGFLVGFVAMWRLGEYMEHVASIGISVHPHYWGKGFATQLINATIELARKKKLKRLEVETLSENTPMRYVVEKQGFKLESLRKNRIKKGEQYHDGAVYSLLL